MSMYKTMKIKTMLLCTALLASCLLINSCSIFTPYTPPIQQGKILPTDVMQKIKPGMSKNQIEYILGSPDIIDPLVTNQWSYIYSFQKGVDTPRQEKKLISTFDKGNKLTFINGNYPPPEIIYQTRDNK